MRCGRLTQPGITEGRMVDGQKQSAVLGVIPGLCQLGFVKLQLQVGHGVPATDFGRDDIGIFKRVGKEADDPGEGKIKGDIDARLQTSVGVCPLSAQNLDPCWLMDFLLDSMGCWSVSGVAVGHPWLGQTACRITKERTRPWDARPRLRIKLPRSGSAFH